jgi:ABC-type antimicrobial peptide transport system permease subunit
VLSLQSRIDPQARPWELGATVFTIYGAFAVLLAALGLYAAIAHGVVSRTREMGVRIAIGARARQILRLILLDGVRIGLVGLGIGLAITIIAADRLGERLTELLFRVAPTDGLVLGGVAGVLFVAVLLASLIPAWRATHVDPMIAMRAE